MAVRQLKLPDIFQMLKTLLDKKAVITVSITLFLLAGSAGSANLPTHYGFQLAVPNDDPQLDSTITIPFVTYRIYIDLLLRVNDEGEVSAVNAKVPADSNYAGYFGDYLKTMRLRPGRFKDTPVELILPVRLNFKRHQRLPALTFPLDREGLIRDRDLYFSAFVLNGFGLPRIESFPSYNYQFKGSIADSLSYPFFILKLNLDESGRPTAVSKLTAVSPPFTDQIMNAVNWGRYAPLEIKGEPAPSECFLLITHLPQASYPCREYIAGDSTLSLRDRLRVRLLPDTVGLMSPPLPRNIIDNKIVCASDEVTGTGDAIVLVSVDTLGKAKFIDLDQASWNKKKNVLAVLPDLKFYPAFDFQGRPQAYKGYLRMSFNTTRSVGIDIIWLSN